MIEVQHLVKWYGPNKAVDDLSFAIPKGKIVGFLGPNGAGKSTTLRMLTGYLPPTSGRAMLAGFDVTKQSAEARAKIGYMPESTPLYLEMRVEEYLHFRGKLQGMSRNDRRSRIDYLTDRCGLKLVRKRLIGQLSKGNRQRVGLAQALLHNPPILILDEPTAGLDPTQIGHVRELIHELRGDHTVILSTHILEQIEKSADRAIIIAQGRIVADGTLEELTAGAAIRMEIKADEQAVLGAVRKVKGVEGIDTTRLQSGWTRAVIAPKKHTPIRESLGDMVKNNSWTIREMHTESLESLFVKLTAEQDQAPSEHTNTNPPMASAVT